MGFVVVGAVLAEIQAKNNPKCTKNADFPLGLHTFQFIDLEDKNDIRHETRIPRGGSQQNSIVGG